MKSYKLRLSLMQALQKLIVFSAKRYAYIILIMIDSD